MKTFYLKYDIMEKVTKESRPIDAENIDEAKEDGLNEIELIEAVPAPKDEYVWCTYHGETIERAECKKSECSYYSSKSGRGICEHRGSYFLHGDKVTFKQAK